MWQNGTNIIEQSWVEQNLIRIVLSEQNRIEYSIIRIEQRFIYQNRKEQNRIEFCPSRLEQFYQNRKEQNRVLTEQNRIEQRNPQNRIESESNRTGTNQNRIESESESNIEYSGHIYSGRICTPKKNLFYNQLYKRSQTGHFLHFNLMAITLRFSALVNLKAPKRQKISAASVSSVAITRNTQER